MGKNLADINYLTYLARSNMRSEYERNLYDRFEIPSLVVEMDDAAPDVSVIDIIDPWCEDNLKGKFAIFTGVQHFQFEEDKAAFILRWC